MSDRGWSPIEEVKPDEIDLAMIQEIQSDPDCQATEDDMEAHRIAMEEYARGETVPHKAINWD